jgi:hypothetical protein
MPKERLGALSGIVSLWTSNHFIPSMMSTDLSGASSTRAFTSVPGVDGVLPIPDAPAYAPGA